MERAPPGWYFLKSSLPKLLYLIHEIAMASPNANITVVDVKAVGAFGRLTLAGKEGDVEEAAAAAIRAIEEISNYWEFFNLNFFLT